MSKDFSGWDFGHKMLNQYAWHNPASYSEYGRQAQELIEHVLPGFKTSGEEGFLKVYLIRVELKCLTEANAVEQNMDWMADTIRYVFDIGGDPEFGERYVPEPLAEMHRNNEHLGRDHMLPNFNVGLTMQDMIAQIEKKEVIGHKWIDLMNAPYEIT